MPIVDRRAAALIALLAPLITKRARAELLEGMSGFASRTPPIGTPPHRGETIAMLLYPGVTALDLVGPQYMFAALEGARVHLVARTAAPVTSDTGLVLTPTMIFADCPADVTVLFAPGGTDGTLAAMRDTETLAFMADRGSRAKYVASVCTGSLVLGAAGLLRGYRATSHWAARAALAGFGAIPTEARVVRDRNRMTGAGVTAGLDLGLTMLAELRSTAYAELVQLGCEYDPHPPFTAGSPGSAPAAIRDQASASLAGFVARAEDIAGR